MGVLSVPFEGESQFFLHPATLAPLVIGWVVALFAPDDILEKVSALKGFAEFMSILVPVLPAYASHSAFPEPTLLFFAILWFPFPFQVFSFYRTVKKRQEAVLVEHWKTMRLKVSLIWPMVFALGMGGMFYFAKDPSFCQGCVNSSRIGMALIGATWPLGTCIGFVYCFGWLKNMRSIYFNNDT